MLNGFGAERIGLAALRAPVAATLIVALATLLAALGIFRLGYSGANIDMLRDGSQEIADYDELLNSFRNFNNDAIVLLRGNSFDTVEGIETYRDLHFDFQFDEQVESVLSLFSLVRYDGTQGGWQSALPARFESDEEVRAALDALARDIPNSRSLFDPQGGSAVMVVYVNQEAVQDATVRDTIDRFKEIAAQYASDDLQITIAGQPAIRSDLIVSIVGDMLKLLPLAAVFCAAIAWLIFRNFTAVFICVAAPSCALIWLLGGMGLAGIDITFLTNILPVLIVVVVFSDSLHLFMKWNRLATDATDPSAALEESVAQVGPACTVSALTTALALFSLVLAGNQGLTELGIVGGLAMVASLLAVLVVAPLAIYWANKAGLSGASEQATRLSRMARPAIAAFHMPVPVVTIGVVLTVIGLIAHFQIESRFRLVDYLSADSSVAQSEGFIDDAYPGSTPLFAIVRIDKTKPTLDPANLDRFYKALDAVGRVFPSSSFYSLADFRDEIEKGGGTIKEEDFDELPEYLTRRFISPERDKGLITIFSSANMEAAEMRALVTRLRQELADGELQDFVAVTGYPVLSSIVAPNLMDKLRLSLIAAIAMSIVLVMFSARSVRLGLACLLPNLLPVVSVELVLWLAGIPLNMSITVALTVAFGLAINDSIHLLNQYMILRPGQAHTEAMAEALRQVITAMVSSTLILVGGLVIMMFSTLPLIVLFSAVMILTLVFAIVFNVFQLPAMMLLLEKGGDAPEMKPGVQNREVGR
jgi:uncharacterized protein